MREHEKERKRERSTKCTGGSVRKKERKNTRDKERGRGKERDM